MELPLLEGVCVNLKSRESELSEPEQPMGGGSGLYPV